MSPTVPAHAGPHRSAETGVDKAGIVRSYLRRGHTVAFAGDGFADLPAAFAVSLNLRFARADLAVALGRYHEDFHTFSVWSDVADALLAMENQGKPTNNSQIRVPSLVRIKPGALPRLGTYLNRSGFTDVLVVSGQLPEAVTQMARQGLENNRIHTGPGVEWTTTALRTWWSCSPCCPKTMAGQGLWRRQGAGHGQHLAFLARPLSLSCRAHVSFQ